MNTFQQVYCMTSEERKKTPWLGPYELLDLIKNFIDSVIAANEQDSPVFIEEEPKSLPLATAVGYFILSNFVDRMEELQ